MTETVEEIPPPTEFGRLSIRSLGAAVAPVLAELQLDADIDFLGCADELEEQLPVRTAERPTISIRLYGHLAIVGPVHGGDAPRPCGRCLGRRWQALRSRELRDALELGGRTAAVAESPYLTRFAVDAMCGLVRRLRSEPRPAVPAMGDAVVTVAALDLQTLRTKSYFLVADPKCPQCAAQEPDSAPAAQIRLETSPKSAPDRFRLRSLDDLDLDEATFANPVCGVLGPQVIREYESPTTASAYGRMGMRVGAYLQETFWGGHTFSYADSSRVGLIEGLERYAGMRSPASSAGVVASLDSLRADQVPALDPRECGVYSDEFYRTDPHRVPPFTEDREIPWVWGYSLVREQPVLVPALLTYYHAVPRSERFVQESSNGCASGGSLTEAVYYGLMELIERDAFLLTWYAKLGLREIDGSTSSSATTRALIDRLALQGYRARFFDARITFPVPVVIGMAERIDGGRGTLCFGAGASLDPEQALRSALIEIGTDAPQLPRRTTWGLDRLTSMAADFTKVTKLHDHPLMYGLPEMRRHAEFMLAEREKHSLADAYADVRRRVMPTMDVREDVRACVRTLSDAAFDVIVVDQTFDLQRGLGLHTASVVVPGLVPIDFGWSRQRALRQKRLLQAPFEAGFTDRALVPGDLNPAPHPFP